MIESRRFDVISAGLVVSDILIAPVDHTVFEVDSVYLDSITYATGGDAFNVSINLAKLGCKVAVSCNTGRDMAADAIMRDARKYGVDTSLLTMSDTAPTATSIVFCSSGGERHFAYCPGANREYDGSNLTDEVLKQTKILFIGSMMALNGLDGEVLAGLFKRAKSFGVITAMDVTWPGDGIWLPRIEKALPYTDIFIPSHYEAKMFAGCENRENNEDIIRFMHDKGVGIAGVKLGAEGVQIEDFKLAAYFCDDKDKVDTCGAGDAFMSGLLCGISKGKSLRDSAVLGSAVSNFCIRAPGATTNTCSYEQAIEFIANNGEPI